MYCPRCGTENNEGTRFCRSCGANLSLVPQALTGELPSRRARREARRDQGHSGHGQLSLTEGIATAFAGAGFVLVALLLVFLTRQWWGIFLLIPGFVMLGRGVAGVVGSKQMQGYTDAARPPLDSPARTNEIRPPDTGPILPPPSVTETTTRHLNNSEAAGKEAK